ncbi:hypothetical protein AVEN_157227-1, partial [Araneus ventricosus]
METAVHAQQTSVLSAPAESISAFPFGGNKPKSLFGTSEVKRERETTENDKESEEVAVES